MARFPEAQRRAQAELDAVVGTRRLPELSDRPSLPYITALVKEVLRWHSPGPIGSPRQAVADDEYGGYLIPGGALIFANIWFAVAKSVIPLVIQIPDPGLKPQGNLARPRGFPRT